MKINTHKLVFLIKFISIIIVNEIIFVLTSRIFANNFFRLMADIVLNPAVRYELAIENNSIIYKFMISSFLKFLVLISTISFFSKLLFKDEEIFTLIKKNLKLILYLTITIPFVFSILLFLNFLIPDTTKIFVKSNINFFAN